MSSTITPTSDPNRDRLVRCWLFTKQAFIRLPWIFLALVVALSLSLPFSLEAGVFGTVRVYDEGSGLPSSEVYSIVQTADGLIWFGTRRGIASYDGYNWRMYELEARLTNTSISRLLVDSQGGMYALDEFGGIYSLISDQFVKVASIRDQVANPRWIELAAIVSCDTTNNLAMVFGDSLYFYQDGRIEKPLYQDRKWRSVTALAALDKWFLVGTKDGLHVFDKNQEIPIPAALKALDIPCLRAIHLEKPSVENGYSGDRYWFVDCEKVGYLEKGKLTILSTYQPYSFGKQDEYLRISPDGSGGLLAASNLQLIHVTSDGVWRKLGIQDGLATEGAYEILLDHENSIWIASYRGVSKIHGFWFENFYAVNGLFADEVSSIVALPNGSMMMGHLGGLTIWRDGVFHHIPFRDDDGGFPGSQSRVLDMAIDEKRNTVWIAAVEHGLLKSDLNGNYTRYQTPDPMNGVHAVLTQDNGKVLIGSKMGFLEFDPIRETFTLLGDVGGFYIRVLYSPPGENIAYVCVATKGVYRWDGRKLAQLPWAEDYPSRDVFNLVRTPWGELLAGTRGGLVRVTADGIEPALIGNRTIDRPIYLFYADDSKLWIGTDSGLHRTDGNEIRHYSVAEGLSGNELNRNAVATGPRGRIWFGTSRGLTVYDGGYDRDYHSELKVTLYSVEAEGVLHDPKASIKLPPNRSSLKILYQAISYVYEDQIQFRYTLKREGEEDPREVITNNREVQFLNLSSGSYQVAIQARHRDGDWGPVSETGSITVLAPIIDRWWFRVLALTGLIGLFVLVHRYLISRRTTRILQSEVQLERAKLSQVVRNTRTLIVQADHNAVITYVNPDVQSILGYHQDEIVGKPYHAMLHPDDRQEIVESFQRQIQSQKKTAILQCRLVAKSGEIFWYGFTISLSFNSEGKVVGMTAVAQDITERRELEERLHHSQKMEAVGMLAGGVAHDFNNLLTAITGYTELAQFDSRDNPEMLDHLFEIQKAAKSAADLTRQLLAFSRKQTLQPRILNLNSVILNRVTMLKRLLGEDVRLELDLADELWMIRADQGQLEQVIVNLAVNGRDAITGGGWLTLRTVNRRVEIEEVRGVPQGEYVQFDIKDTGTGIPVELQERIFEPFFTTKEKGRGTGLGLATVYGVISQSEGYISLQSTPGEGTTFTILLPRTLGQSEEIENPMQGKRAGRGSERILVVEDEESVRTLAVEVLRRQGYEVLEAVNGEEALELIEVMAKPAHLLLTDVIMPKVNGPELAEQVLDHWPGTRVLFMSGYTASYIENRGLLSEGYPLLVKPFRTEDLARKVREILDQQS